MSRTPNPEQLLAIEHNGGVLLKAGAGSGKTFVLVEHIVYLTTQWINESGHSLDFEKIIKERFSKVVMMTFTTKAAGEMKLRLFKRFDELVELHQSKAWETAREYLTWLTVTTIDGFCRKLIASGYFPELSTSADIIFEEQRTSQVEKIIEDWFNQKHDVETRFWEQLLRSRNEIRDSFCRIFNDPTKRKKWKFFDSGEFSDEKINQLIHTLYKLNNIEHAIAVIANYDVPVDANKYEKELIGRLQMMGLPEIRDIHSLMLYQNECSQKAPSLTAKIKTPELEQVSECYKEIREWVKSVASVVSEYMDYRDETIIPWFKVLYQIYQYVDSKLTPNDGFTFGDIEYYVSLGLDQHDIRKKITNDFTYFIVDEFQDTSYLQFDIIRKLINDDFSKLFCVGDAKQAIYGFRGGELKVFEECSHLVPKNLSLSHNYRSLAEIIKANNSIFEHVLPIGFDASDNDPYTVHFEPQTIPPIDYHGAGELIINDVDLSDIEMDKISNEQLDALEAKIIADQVEDLRNKFPDKQNTILYKKLVPSTAVIRHLMNKKIGFTAQFKIKLLDDPVLGIFYLLIKRHFDRNTETRDIFPLSIINNYLYVLGVSYVCGKNTLDKFEEDIKYFGVYAAFKKFLFSLRITNENADLNLSYINLLCLLYEDNLSVIYSRFKQISDTMISMDLRWGNKSDMVTIMSAHASKGLEFDHVIIGGIFTNSAHIPNKNLMGDNPTSFYWYKNFQEKEKSVTPFYRLEREIEKYKTYSESKRLLYVACTRAVEKLIWSSIDLGELQSKIKTNTWSSLLDSWLVKSSFKNVTVNKLESTSFKAILEQDSSSNLPLFYYDSVGIFQKSVGESELLIVPELSVTRLNSLLFCPRKFYLENVLKLNVQQLTHVNREDDEDDDLTKMLTSSAERGTKLHAAISEGISRNFTVAREFSGKFDEKILASTLKRLQDLSGDYQFISEVPLKFSFFGHMISGTPDLILKPKSDGDYQIWDFKTGRLTEDKLAPYWLQLKVYAYALYCLKQVAISSSIKLELFFIDEQKSLTKEVCYQEIADELFLFWSKQSQPWLKKSEHCSQCNYGDICLK